MKIKMITISKFSTLLFAVTLSSFLFSSCEKQSNEDMDCAKNSNKNLMTVSSDNTETTETGYLFDALPAEGDLDEVQMKESARVLGINEFEINSLIDEVKNTQYPSSAEAAGVYRYDSYRWTAESNLEIWFKTPKLDIPSEKKPRDPVGKGNRPRFRKMIFVGVLMARPKEDKIIFTDPDYDYTSVTIAKNVVTTFYNNDVQAVLEDIVMESHPDFVPVN